MIRGKSLSYGARIFGFAVLRLAKHYAESVETDSRAAQNACQLLESMPPERNNPDRNVTHRLHATRLVQGGVTSSSISFRAVFLPAR